MTQGIAILLLLIVLITVLFIISYKANGWDGVKSNAMVLLIAFPLIFLMVYLLNKLPQ